MSELIPPPSEWKFRLNLDAATLTSQLGKHRLQPAGSTGRSRIGMLQTNH